MLSDRNALAVVAAATAAGIEPAALLAIVEVEADGGRPFEADGSTPCLLYERHVAYREARKRDCLDALVAAGLAIPKWDKATQYRDERTSAQRLDLIGRAAAIDKETAYRSASWGLGQTMGNLAETLGFTSAVEMVAHMTGSVEGQVDCMVREVQYSHLVEPLNRHDWTHVARIYNGPGYAANQYDSRLAEAYKRWSRRVATLGSDLGAPDPSPEQIRRLQERLRDLGYHEVGDCDGSIGSRTIGAISAFQAHEGLPVTGRLDEATVHALNSAEPRPVSQARGETTADDLRNAGSRTIGGADATSTAGKVIAAGGVAGAAEGTGTLDTIKHAADEASTLREALEGLTGAMSWLAAHWWVAALIVGAVAVYQSRKVIAARLADHRAGIHPGSFK